jgi:hypothetical protein
MANHDQYPEIKAELEGAGHPITGPYSTDPNPQFAADELNAINIVDDVDMLPASVIFEAVLNNKAEWDAMTPDNRQWVRDILTINESGGIPTAVGTPARTQLVAVLGTATKAELATKISTTISRAVQLGWGTIRPGDIDNARAL